MIDPQDDEPLTGDETPPEADDEEEDDREDPISDAFFDLVADKGMEVLWMIVGEMVDDEDIQDVPAEDSTEEEQRAWLQASMPKIRERFAQYLDGDESDTDS